MNQKQKLSIFIFFRKQAYYQKLLKIGLIIFLFDRIMKILNLFLFKFLP